MKVMRSNDLRVATDPVSTSIDRHGSAPSEGVTSHFVSQSWLTSTSSYPGATGLWRLMHLNRADYEQSRTHLSLSMDAPISRPIVRTSEGRIVAIPQVDGLHRLDEWHRLTQTLPNSR